MGTKTKDRFVGRRCVAAVPLACPACSLGGRAFARNGGMVGIDEKQHRIRFAVDVDAAARSDIPVSSKLLQLASVVRETP